MKKILSMLFIAVYFLIFVFGMRVYALELTEEAIDNVWYFRKGGGSPSFSAQFKYYEIDGKTTYCIEPGEHITTHNYIPDDIMNSPYSNDINDLLNLIGYYGYDYPGHNTLRYRMATQALIWENTGGQVVEYWTKPSGAGTFINVDTEKSEIMSLVNSHPILPSFNGKKLTGYWNYVTSFTDNNNTLSYFKVLDSNNYDYTIDGNILNITPRTNGLVEVNLQRDTYTDNMTTYFVGVDSKTQTMGYFGLSVNDKFKVYVNSRGGTINLQKIDSYNFNSTPRGDATLEGAVYAVYDSEGNKIDEIVIGSNGLGTSKVLGLGSYTVKEIMASEGYSVDNTTHSFTISKGNLNPSKKVTEWAISSMIDIFKVINDKNTGVLTPEIGITFDYYLKRTGVLATTVTTDENGYANTYLPYGTYVVSQRNTTPGYERTPDFEIVVSTGEIIRKIIADGVFSGLRLKVTNRDMDTNNIIKRDGVKFKIKNLDNNEYVCQNVNYPDYKVICEYETKNGIFITPENLIYGNYELEEIDQIIDGYLWNSAKIPFKVDETQSNIELDFYNKEVKGELDLLKYGEEFIVDNNNYEYKDILLDNVTFELYTANNIYSSDGSLIYEKDKLISNFNTSNGTFKISNLYLGDYYLKEINTDNNHILLSSPIYFSLDYKDQYTNIVNVSIELRNNLKKGKLIINNLEKDTNNIISDSKFNIYDKDDNIIYKGITSGEGLIILDNLKVGKYSILQTYVKDGYILDNNKYVLEVKEDGEEIIIYNEKEAIENYSLEELSNTISEEYIEEVIDVPITYVNDNYKYYIASILLLLGITKIYEIKKYN